MGEEPKTAKPDGSAWAAHLERVTARNDAARKAGRNERAEQERSKLASLRAAEARQATEHARRVGQTKAAASLLRSD